MQAPAIIFENVERAALIDLDMPHPRRGEVRIRTRASVMSGGTEGWAFRQMFTWATTPFPCVPGYQRAGVIETLGEGVTGWQVGERVMATVGRWDGPVVPFWGSHAALANTVEGELYRIPDGVDDLDAAGTVVAQVGYNAASRAVFQPGEWVVVYGDGLIGQCAAQAARARGARVVLVGHRPERLSLAEVHSADAVVNSYQSNLVGAVREHTGGAPVVALLDSVQSEEAQRQYIDLLESRRGQVVYCGFTPGKTWADMGLLQQRELTTHYVSGWTRARMEATLALMGTGQMRLRPLITHFVSYRQGPAMYAMNLEKSASFLGIAFDWGT